MQIGFLIQITDGGRLHSATQQGFRYVLHPPHGYACKVHLDQCLFHRTFTAAVELYDSGFKWYTFQLRYFQAHLSGGRVQLPAIMPRAVALTRLGALVLCRVRQLFGFFVQQFIQRFLHTVSDYFFQFPLDAFLV